MTPGPAIRSLPVRVLSVVPRQARAVRRVHDILDAAMTVLVLEGAETFSSNRVAEQAGVSVGSVYKYFANKDRILAGIVERGLLGSEQTIRDGLVRAVEEDLHEVAVQVMCRLVADLEPFRPLFRELFCGAPLLRSPSVQTLTVDRLVDAVRATLLHPVGPYRPTRGEATLFVAVNGCVFAFLRWIVDAPSQISRQAFAESVADILATSLEPVAASGCSSGSPRDHQSA